MSASLTAEQANVMNDLLAAAESATGLSDFGEESFREPFRVLVASLIEEARLTDAGLEGQKNRILGLLINRLRIEQAYKDHPEIEAEKIERPTCIVGLPRTGTTMLFRILGDDPRFFVPYFYEVRYPFKYATVSDSEDDPRIALVEAEIQAILDSRPELAAIHPMNATAAEEEINILENSFYSTVPEAFNHLPSYSRWLEENDNEPGYRYLVRVLKLLQWQKKQAGEAGERWVLKTPHHIHHLELLLKTFPDVKILLTHRDPLQTIPSIVSFHNSLYRLGSNEVDPVAIGAHWQTKFSKSMRVALAMQDKHPDKFVDVDYWKLVAEPLNELEMIYQSIGMDFTSNTVEQINQWQVENRRDKRAPHKYDMADYGLSEAVLEESFKEYRQRHILN